MDLLALSRALIATDTVSHNGTAAAVDVLRPLYEQAGLEVVVQDIVRSGVHHQNLLGTYPGAGPGGLLLVTHLDTADPGLLDSWTETGGEPLEMTRKGDRLYGLGAADAKLDALCQLFAARDFRDRKLERPLQLLGTFGQELGGQGALHFVTTPDFRARFAACSEPSELAVVRGHKGHAVVHVEILLREAAPELTGPLEQVAFKGRSTHAATPHLGVNAIEQAVQAVGDGPVVSLEGGTSAYRVPDHCVVVRPATGAGAAAEPPDRRNAGPAVRLACRLFELWRELVREQQPEVDPAFEPDRATVNWAVARASGPRCELVFGCRLLPGHDPEAVTSDFIHHAIRQGAADHAEVRVEIVRSSPGMMLGESSELLATARAACRDVGLADQPRTLPNTPEAGIFAQKGIEALAFGPGRAAGNTHLPNEFNLLSQMEKAIEFYRALITRLCV